MKTLAYKDWVKNPVPRDMWVWDNFEEDKVVRKVIFFIEKEDAQYPVVSITSNGCGTSMYMHCAEIEKQSTRRMTHKELAHWLREKSTREFKYKDGISIYSVHTYDEDCGGEEVANDVIIRENDEEWKEPLIEVTDD